MKAKRGLLLVIGMLVLILLSAGVEGVSPLNITTIESMTSADLSNAPSCIDGGAWHIFINTGNTGSDNCYGEFYYKTLQPSGVTWRIPDECTASGTMGNVYLKFTTTSAGSCEAPSGTITLRHDDGEIDVISYDAASTNTYEASFQYRSISLNGSSYESNGLCNMTQSSVSHDFSKTLSIPTGWSANYKETGGWILWNGTINLSNAQVMLNHSTGKYIIFQNISTRGNIDYNLSSALLINDTVIGVNESDWGTFKKNVCLDTTKNMTIMTPTNGTFLKKYNSTNSALINGSVMRSIVPTNLWTVSADVGFSTYLAAMKSTLHIFEDYDPAYFNQTVKFSANYTNITNNEMIGGMNCSIWFSDWNNWTNMTNATSSGIYEFNRTFSNAGLYLWNVSCNESTDSFDYFMLAENITITNYSRLVLLFHSPAGGSGISKNSLFNISLGITCRDYQCGNMTAALDPLSVSDVSGQEEMITVVKVKEEVSYPSWKMLAFLLAVFITTGAIVALSKLKHNEKAAIFIFLSIAAAVFIFAQQPAITSNVIYDSTVHLVNMTRGATPFYTLNNNTYNLSHYSCLDNLQADASCNVTWEVNATGTAGNKYEFFAAFNSTTYNLTNNTERRNITINAVCGNSACETGESCTSCQTDCGACPSGGSTSSGVVSCIPKWTCSEWSACIEGLQTRNCTDGNCSGILGGRPAKEQACVPLNQAGSGIDDGGKVILDDDKITMNIENPSPISININGRMQCGWLCWLYIILLIILTIAVLLMIFFLIAVKKKKEKTQEKKKLQEMAAREISSEKLAQENDNVHDVRAGAKHQAKKSVNKRKTRKTKSSSKKTTARKTSRKHGEKAGKHRNK